MREDSTHKFETQNDHLSPAKSRGTRKLFCEVALPIDDSQSHGKRDFFHESLSLHPSLKQAHRTVMSLEVGVLSFFETENIETLKDFVKHFVETLKEFVKLFIETLKEFVLRKEIAFLENKT